MDVFSMLATVINKICITAKTYQNAQSQYDYPYELTGMHVTEVANFSQWETCKIHINICVWKMEYGSFTL